MNKLSSELSNEDIFTNIGDLLMKYDYRPQAELLYRFAKYFHNADPDTEYKYAKSVLDMFGGWGGLVDIVLADENGINIEDNRNLDDLRNNLYSRMDRIFKKGIGE